MHSLNATKKQFVHLVWANCFFINTTEVIHLHLLCPIYPFNALGVGLLGAVDGCISSGFMPSLNP